MLIVSNACIFTIFKFTLKHVHTLISVVMFISSMCYRSFFNVIPQEKSKDVKRENGQTIVLLQLTITFIVFGMRNKLGDDILVHCSITVVFFFSHVVGEVIRHTTLQFSDSVKGLITAIGIFD